MRESDNSAAIEMYSKLEQYCLRFALILEQIEQYTLDKHRDKVGLQVMKGAIKITEYFRSNNTKALKKIYKESSNKYKDQRDIAIVNMYSSLNLPYEKIASIFGIGKSMVGNIIKDRLESGKWKNANLH